MVPQRSQRRDVRVLQSYGGPFPRTNPYIVQLHDSLRTTLGVTPLPFSWRTALLGGYDVFHAHWPEALIERRGWISTLGRRALYVLFLTRMWLLGIPVVRTVHNIELPQGISRTETRLLLGTDYLTRTRIVLNEFTPVPPGAEVVLIEHGHYRDWFSSYLAEPPVQGRVLFFGKVRRYKNVTGLVRAFRQVRNDTLSLHVVGSPSSRALADSLRAEAAGDARIALTLEFAGDDELVKEITEAQLVVLPYPEMHNSGSVLAALSLDRGLLVPDNDFNQALAEEVGSTWVNCFDRELKPTDIEHALALVGERVGRPNLNRRNWVHAGEKHLTAYRRALGRGRRING